MKIGLSLFAVAAAALLAVGCGGDKGGGEDEANYDGWMLTRWKDGTALTGTVYLQLGEDGIFSLYQSIGTFGYARFTGTYALVGDPATGQVLSGTYADGTPWDSSYAVEKMTKRELRLRALGRPIVSTSANISGEATPVGLQDVAREIIDGVDFVVNPRFEGKPTRKASSIIAFGEGGEVKIIRE